MAGLIDGIKNFLRRIGLEPGPRWKRVAIGWVYWAVAILMIISLAAVVRERQMKRAES